MIEGLIIKNPEMDLLTKNKESGFNYRERRQNDWDENYTLYRDKVIYNRLTQRQSVNIPLMKQTVRTILKDIDDMPVLFFENLDNDKDKEIFKNEFWKLTAEENKLEIKDIVDKRQVLLYGRSFTQLQIVDGKIKLSIEDPEDILIDRYTDPTDIDSARFLIHTHIYRPLSSLENNTEYDREAIAGLKKFYASELGLIKAADNMGEMERRNRKMQDMGLSDVGQPILGETYVELSLHFVYRKENGDRKEQLYLYVEADNLFILLKKPLDKIIGETQDDFWKNHLPYSTWADDVDRQDFWSDGIADIVRTPNKVLNSWFSQLVENRTMRNFGMHYYDATVEGFQPQTFEPVPWGWYGVPGKPQEVLQKVDIPDLSESLDEMNFITTMIEKATGATSTQQGVQTERQITLGEVQLALGEAKERVKGISKFYTPAWKDRGLKFIKLIEAAPDKINPVNIYKKGRNSDNIYSREIEPKDWMSQSGYKVRIWSQDEKKNHDTTTLEKLNVVRANIPGNHKLEEIFKRKLLEFADIAPDEINEIMDTEKQNAQRMQQAAAANMVQSPQPTGNTMTVNNPAQAGLNNV